MRLTRFQILMMATLLLGLLIFASCSGGWRWLWLALLCSTSGLLVGLGVSFPHWQMFGPSLCRVPTRLRHVALTFDDGPDPTTTPALLALLKERNCRATFFCIGARLAQAPELARQIVAAGHAVENHSFAHDSWMNVFSEARLRSDIGRAQQLILSVTGSTPRFYRPPMGLTNQRVFRVCAQLGLDVAGYTVRGLDRRPQPPELIVERLLRNLHPGDILLLHDGGVPMPQLLSVMALLLTRLESLGYQSVRLDEMVHGAKPRIDSPSLPT